MREPIHEDKPGLGFIGNYLPRRCGIATFTTDLCEAVSRQVKESCDCFAIAMNDIPEGYPYPERVRFEIRRNVLSDYSMAAEFLNIGSAEIVCIQHEYGIFGGPAGRYILTLMKNLRMPIVVTLHTVLKEPDPDQHTITEELGNIADRLIVMSMKAKAFLKDIFHVREDKIIVIPHGIPDLPMGASDTQKDLLGLKNRKVILTFGLLSPGKGYEYMLDAMNEIVKECPEVVYILLGATHPNIVKLHGEEYRISLQRQVRASGLENHVLFYNRFVDLKELCDFLCAADIYVAPYLKEEQIVSGTLSYALGAGNAVISTPTWYATEVLSDGRGRIVPFKDSRALAREIIKIISDKQMRKSLQTKAYKLSRRMIWKEVGKEYTQVFNKVRSERAVTPHPVLLPGKRPSRLPELPEIDIRHLITLTDGTGILQHATFATPARQHGYTTDDNARALIVACLHYNLLADTSVLPLVHTYMAFLDYAFNHETNRFRNFMSYDRKWLEEVGSEDSHGRALWGLGLATAYPPYKLMLGLTTRLMHQALHVTEEFTSLRAIAFSIVGIHAYLRQFGGDSEVRRVREILSNKLYNAFHEHATDDWPWPENTVTYANAILPLALLLSGQWMQRPEMVEMGLKTLRWLLDIQTGDKGQISIIGNRGWYTKRNTKACFDQQPLEVTSLIEGCLEALNVTRDENWLSEADRCFQWFLGNNDLNAPLYDFTTRGCCDGLTPDGPNNNQGAESTVAWLLSLLQIQASRETGAPYKAQNFH